MTYQEHHDDLHLMLKEFERTTGTGNMKNSNLAMMKMIKSLVAMVESLPTCQNCTCVIDHDAVYDVLAVDAVVVPQEEESAPVMLTEEVVPVVPVLVEEVVADEPLEEEELVADELEEVADTEVVAEPLEEEVVTDELEEVAINEIVEEKPKLKKSTKKHT